MNTRAHDVAARRAAADTAANAGDVAAARAHLSLLWRDAAGPTVASIVNASFAKLALGAVLQPFTVAILRSFTLEPTVPLLRAAAFVGGFDATVHLGDFNTYAQDILDPSSPLYGAWAPDAVVLAVQTRDIAPELWDGYAQLTDDEVETAVERVVSELGKLIEVFRQRSRASLVIHTLEQPAYLAHGVLDAQRPLGQAEAVRMINARLAEVARSHPGVHLLDYDGLVARCGRDAWHDEQKWLTMRMPIRAAWHATLASEWLRFMHPIGGRVSKALIVDLDNTLWGGVLGEDGPDGIVVGTEHPGAAYRALQRVMLDLYARGIILGIASKNDHDDAIAVLESHAGMLVRPSHVAVTRIDWGSKADNLRSIAEELNIGLDALAFMDDNPVECQLVRSQLPEVTVIELPPDPGRYAEVLRSCPQFERLTLSAEDRDRGRLYAERREWMRSEQAFSSLEGFLASLGTTVRVAPVTAKTVARAAQLTQKTNQFNTTTRRYSEQDIARLAVDDRWRVLTVDAADRLSDHGIIGVAIVERMGGAWDVDSLLLSCRVIGRGIETAMLAVLADLARADGATHVTGAIVPTAKNVPARDVYAAHGFALVGEEGGIGRWSLDLGAATVTVPTWLASEFVEGVRAS